METTTTSKEALADCAVCWTEAEEPIRTSCGHVYSGRCFTDMCQAEASVSTEYRIKCVSEGRFGNILTLAELQECLSSAAFEDVLEAFFASYIRRHPASFRYCPKPDCGGIYRPAPEGNPLTKSIFTCDQCLKTTCTVCHCSNPDMTCAEDKYMKSGGDLALEKIKKELGVKDCPECKTAMEKIEGSNHMTCRGCGTHLFCRGEEPLMKCLRRPDARSR